MEPKNMSIIEAIKFLEKVLKEKGEDVEVGITVKTFSPSDSKKKNERHRILEL